MTSKNPKKKLIKQLDAAFKKILYATHPNKCITCGAKENLSWSHLITSSKYATRWNMKNVHIQCLSCNFRHEHYPEYYTNWFLRKYGQEEYKKLVKKSWSREGKPFTMGELRKLLERLNKIV